MRFSIWASLADEYASIFWLWRTPDYDMEQAYRAYQLGDTPKDFIDRVARLKGQISYADTHGGKLPPDFKMWRYTTNYGD